MVDNSIRRIEFDVYLKDKVSNRSIKVRLLLDYIYYSDYGLEPFKYVKDRYVRSNELMLAYNIRSNQEFCLN